MEIYRFKRDKNGRQIVEMPRRGIDVLRSPLYNKGTAFTADERREFRLEGLLPIGINSMEQQAQRIYAAIRRKTDPMEQYIGLGALQDRNEHLYYRVLTDHFEEFLPIVYTPTVGQACREYSRVFRRGRGLWITPEHRGRIVDILRNARFGNVQLIVATDNEAILGIGDQGAGGMAISVGKLALYCAGAGIHPSQTLPISLDVGTSNQELLDDELYLGWRHPRLTGDDYLSLIDEFVEAVQEVYPGTFIQWEDFRKNNALNVLDRYRSKVLSFNDDIQGTGAVALAAMLSGCRIGGQSLKDQRIIIFGAGAAGLGIARQLRAGLAADGLSGDDLTQAVALLDSRGLLVDDRDLRDDYKRELAWSGKLAADIGLGDPDKRDLAEVIRHYKPTALIGSSGQGGAFNEDIIRAMCEHCERPIILPFSNPTDLCEVKPADAIAWSDGKALVATGSPFKPVEYEGRTIHIGQGNNVFIFPGLGLGALVSGARTITDSMITEASRTLAEMVDDSDLDKGLLFPPIPKLRHISKGIAVAVVRQAVADGVCDPIPDDDIIARVTQAMWKPEYPDYVPV